MLFVQTIFVHICDKASTCSMHRLDIHNQILLFNPTLLEKKATHVSFHSVVTQPPFRHRFIYSRLGCKVEGRYKGMKLPSLEDSAERIRN